MRTLRPLHWILLCLIVVPALRAQDSAIEEALNRANTAIDEIVAVPSDERTVENTLLAFDDAVARFFEDSQRIAFMAQVSTDAEERERGRKADQAQGEWFIRLTKREDLYEAMKELEGSDRAPKDGEPKRLLEQLLRDFRREGMGLSEEKRNRILEIDNQLNELGIDFRRRISEDESVLFLTPEEVKGTTESFRSTLERADDVYIWPVKGPAIFQIYNQCQVPDTRLKMVAAVARRAGSQNVTTLEKMIALRAEKAKLLGYANHVDYQTETRMAKNAKAVADFYEDLRPKLRKKAKQDYAELLAAKRKDTGDASAELEAWDVRYYQNWLMREKYSVDTEAIRAYFPMEAVTDGLFRITQTLYGLEYKDVTDQADTWHDDVKLFEVWDKASNELMGKFYLDLYPRPNKYSHAAKFSIRLGQKRPNGERVTPIVALVCNFTKPTQDEPSLLSHDEVETYFHEFGHCLHSILGDTDVAWFSGTQVARDFVEAPSQMFENWVWDARVLKSFTKHYQTGEPLPDELIEGLIAARNLGSGLSTEGQVYLGMMDYAFHVDPKGDVDTTELASEIYSQTRMFDPLPGYFQASFGHLVGYDAGYYGYLWSLVYASDMFSRFEELGMMSPEAGRLYREKVLSKGGTRDELEMVQDFLGRESNADAFLKHLGLDAGNQ
ncbi:MAG: M3 family metallopeptidase [Planctomycetota bacterium]